MLTRWRTSISVAHLCFVQQRNHASVTVVVDPADYAVVLDELAANGEQVTKLANGWQLKHTRHTASYDALIAEYYSSSG